MQRCDAFAVASSRQTLAANGLRVLEDGVMLKSEANLIVSRTADWPTAKRADLEDLLRRLDATPL